MYIKIINGHLTFLLSAKVVNSYFMYGPEYEPTYWQIVLGLHEDLLQGGCAG